MEKVIKQSSLKVREYPDKIQQGSALIHLRLTEKSDILWIPSAANE